MNSVFWLTVASVTVSGMLAGLSFDTAVVKLPTRKRIGVISYAKFAQGNDLGNGLIVYPIMGGLALVLVVVTTIAAYLTRVPSEVMTPLLIGVSAAIIHSLCTTQAAPIMLNLKHAQNDERVLSHKLNRFAFWNDGRAIFQFLTFVLLIWALVKLA